MKFWHIVLVTLSIGLVAGVVTSIYLARSQGLQFYSVETSAMAPVLLPGDMNIAKKVSPVELMVGDVVTYRTGGVTETKRVRSIDTKTSAMTVAADNQDQSFETIQLSVIQAKTVQSIPLLGYVLNELRHPAVLIGLVYIPVALIIVRETRHLARATWRKPYNISS